MSSDALTPSLYESVCTLLENQPILKTVFVAGLSSQPELPSPLTLSPGKHFPLGSPTCPLYPKTAFQSSVSSLFSQISQSLRQVPIEYIAMCHRGSLHVWEALNSSQSVIVSNKHPGRCPSLFTDRRKPKDLQFLHPLKGSQALSQESLTVVHCGSLRIRWPLYPSQQSNQRPVLPGC